MTAPVDARIRHAWWASDRPLAYLMCGYREPMATHPAIWIRTFDPEFIAQHGDERDEFAKYTDLILGFLKPEAFETFVRFMDALCAQIESVKMPQPNPIERGQDEEGAPQ